jgi:hypothetical protein
MEQVKQSLPLLGRWMRFWGAHPSGAGTQADALPTSQAAASAAAGGQADVLDENAILARTLATVQQRSSRMLASYAAKVQLLDAEVMRLRAAVILRDSALQLALGDQLRHGWTAPR